MAGLYIHIPFCKQACNYCNFHFSTSLAYKNDFLGALLKEISLQKDYLGEEKVGTVYFGGGTPSLLESGEMDLILNSLQDAFDLESKAEITLEANPDDIDPDKLMAWKKSGINRLSMGVQSFYDEDLLWMNRAHNASQALDSIKLAMDTGFSNISIDLIYGGPTTTDDHWKKNADLAIGLGVPHLSCYALTVEPNTPLKKMIVQKRKTDVNPEDQARQFLLLMNWMNASGYEQYEISNFAKPGFRSKHNSSYWQGRKYLGLGPSAHSYNGKSRQWNVSNNNLYIQSMNRNELLFESEDLTPVQVVNETIMTALRTAEGIQLEFISSRFGEPVAASILSNAMAYLKTDKLILENGVLRLTNEGKLLADGIAAHLFFEPSATVSVHSGDDFPDDAP